MPWAYAGQILTNPVSGETIEFVQTAADTDGELLAIDLTLTPEGHVPGTHVHPEEERFEVRSGKMKFKLGLKTIIAGPGETVLVPAGKRHRFKNAGDEDAQVRVEIRPALRMEELTTVALADEGRVMGTGMPKPLELALFVREYKREVRAPFPPPWVGRATTAPLAALARRRGCDERYLQPVHARGVPAVATA
ncbi:MAG: cupin domain-containing protein [Solirubrobacterales bacterium]|nr:cupin domain-containing protein [Solirubrobacterales bacterium]